MTVNPNNIMNQHYVPRVYLKQFESGRKRIYVLNNKAHKASPHVKEFSKTQIGYFSDFYTIKNEESLKRLGLSDKDAIEKDFNARAENRFEKVLALILSSTQEISLQVARETAIILLSIKQRNPMFRKVFEDQQLLIETFNRRFNEIHKQRTLLELILKQEGNMTYEDFIEYGHSYITKVAYDPNIPQEMHVQGIVELYRNNKTVANEVVDILLDCQWYIFETSTQYPFITSDNPGFCLDQDEQVSNINFSGKFGFFFP